jgi:hypothetical protein
MCLFYYNFICELYYYQLLIYTKGFWEMILAP